MNLDQEFPITDPVVYLNHAAMGVWPQRTADAVAAFATENVQRGAQHYPRWLETETRLRERLQRLINAPSVADIGLLKSTSEALSVVAYGLDWQAGDNLVITNHEFPSNRIVWESLQSRGVEVKVAQLDSAETPEAAIINMLDKRTRLVSVSSVQYASGLRLDCELLGRELKSRNALFCIDTIQSIGAEEFDVQACHADFVAADGHKWMLSAEGLALFYTTPEARDRLNLNQYGWHMVKHRGDYDRQEWSPTESAQRFECGSPNMLGIHALDASLSLFEEIGMANIAAGLQRVTQFLIDELQQRNGVTILSPTTPDRRAGIVTFEHAKHDSKALHQRLVKEQVICAYRGGGVRFSPHFYTPLDAIRRALNLLD